MAKDTSFPVYRVSVQIAGHDRPTMFHFRKLKQAGAFIAKVMDVEYVQTVQTEVFVMTYETADAALNTLLNYTSRLTKKEVA